jgi:hypothetical protein
MSLLLLSRAPRGPAARPWPPASLGLLLSAALLAWPAAAEGSARDAPRAEEHGVGATKVVVSAEVAATGRTPEEAWREALGRARAEAVSRVAGFSVWAQDLRLRSESEQGVLDAFSSLVHTSTAGRILSERVERHSRLDEELGVAFYGVTLEALVASQGGARDDGFLLEIETTPASPHLRDGEELRLTFRSTREGYLTVLNVLADDRVALLFPNPYDEDRLLAEGEERSVPGEEARRRGVRFRAFLPEGRERAAEMILAVITRDPLPLDFPAAPDVAGELPVLDYQASAELLNGWLVAIPLDRRAEATWQYVIHR